MTPLRLVLACVVAIAAVSPSPARERSRERPLNAEAINAADVSGQTRKPDRAALIKAQVLLERARFSPGAIDGSGSENTRKAIAAFQQQSGLEPTGKLDHDTWMKLAATSSAPAVASYTVTEDDVKGPFNKSIPVRMEAQADLAHLGYTSAAELLAEKFHMTEALLRTLNAGKTLERPGTVIAVANVADGGDDERPAAAKLEVDKRRHVLRAFDSDGRMIAFYPATVGSREKPAPSGMTTITRIATDPTYTYNPKYRFKDVRAKKKFTIKPGPNNPVGLVWIGLAGDGYGIHGTPEPEKIGKAASHGCIRLTNWDALELVGMVEKGTPVEFLD